MAEALISDRFSNCQSSEPYDRWSSDSEYSVVPGRMVGGVPVFEFSVGPGHKVGGSLIVNFQSSRAVWPI